MPTFVAAGGPPRNGTGSGVRYAVVLLLLGLLVAAGCTGAEDFRATGHCTPVTSGAQVPRGSQVPAGASSVLLERGGTYTVTPRSGLTVGAYGTGANPRINGQSVNRLGNVRYDNVDVPSVSGGAAGASGPITVSNSRLGGTAISINTTGTFNTGPAWTVACNDIGTAGLGRNTDSCILMLSPGSRVIGNRISGCGGGPSYGTHGVYAKAENVHIAGNTVAQITNGQAFSLRMRGALVENNRYDGTGHGAAVDWYGQGPASHAGGTIEIRNNDFTMTRMWLDPTDASCSQAGCGGNTMNWKIHDNTFRARAGSQGQPAITGGAKPGSATTWEITNNRLAGFGRAYSLGTPPAALIETGNTLAGL
jgi:hypothetical protein